ncbi:MAG: nucleotide-binding universal stress UspA family protein [Natronomonas sp.]|jgi:nucleotide-binding universal stress UspA family protein
MTHIVIAIDDDEERAQIQAERVAELDWDEEEVSATVLHVFTDNIEGAGISQFRPARKAVDILEDAGIEVSAYESSGDPAERVVAYADKNEADLICVAGRKRSPAGKAVFGSVSQSVMLDSEIPVLFCPSEE